MKKIFIACAAVLCLFTACNDNSETSNDPARAQADSLYEEVMDGHDVGMAKMGRISKMKAETRRLLDSIASLPDKAEKAAEPLRDRLDSLIKDLEEADRSMQIWMNEFKFDSAKNDLMQRIKYLEEEKLKVGKVKSNILQSIEKADSLLEKKF